MLYAVCQMCRISNRLDTIRRAFAVALVFGVGVVATNDRAEAEVIYSGPVSISVPNSVDGVYLNVVTGAKATSPLAGWDLKLLSSVPASNTFNLGGPTVNTWLNNGGGQYRLQYETQIGPSGTFDRPGDAMNVGPQLNLNSIDNYLGFTFVNEGLANMTQFGWVQLEFGSNPGTRRIIAYAYDNTGVGLGAGITAVPEPSALALLAMSAIGFFAARRRRQMARGRGY